MVKQFLSFLILSLCLSFSYAQSSKFNPTPHAHSHNDYLKKKPLWGALENGCTSIEIDVFANDGQLKVSHVNVGLNVKPNLKELYLHPLINYLERESWVFIDTNQVLVLMIDFKNDSQTSLDLLLDLIKDYHQYFTSYSNGEVHYKALQLVISGSGFTYSQVANSDSIFVFLDGSVRSCEDNIPQDLVPRGSARYGSIFKWNGKGEMPEEELRILKTMVEDAKSCNKKLRFYAMPENKSIWLKFLNEGVYWINVDDSKKFKAFLQSLDK